MKTKIILSVLFLTLASVGMGTSAMASVNKHADYRTAVEATKGTMGKSMGASQKHVNKYARQHIANTILPSEPTNVLPKNYRNSF